MKNFNLIACVIFFASLQGCSDANHADKTELVAQSANVWATVEGSELTDETLAYSVSRFFGDQFVDARAELKIRDSLIASRAISLRAQAQLNSDALSEIELATQAYREERLIAAYIEQTATPEPVSAQMVTGYYQSNLAEFGAATIKQIAVLEVDVNKAKLPAAALSKQLFDWSKQASWAQIVLPAYAKIFTVNSNEKLPASFSATVQNMSVGETSSVLVEPEKMVVIRVLAKQELPPKPLQEVSAQIRKRLAAAQLSKTVKEISERIVSESDVVKHY